MKKNYLPIILGFAHGVNDCAAGMLLGKLSGNASIYAVGFLVFLYNVLAFGAQPIAGLITDRIKNPKLISISGILIMAISLPLALINPVISVILAGAGSAMFHVGGGALALCVTPGKAAGPGMFAAPGVAGLALGGYFALISEFHLIPLVVMLGIAAILIILSEIPELPYNIKTELEEFEKHDLVMVIILFAIALRSAIWNIFQLIDHGNEINIVLIGIAAMAGKIGGGFAADKIGWRNYAVSALTISIPLLIFGGSNLIIFLPGIALLQSVTPVLLASVARSLPRLPATASGLTLGLAIAAGGLPFTAGIDIELINSPPVIGISLIISASLLYFALKPRLKLSNNV
jgi:MFS transporter, FSR family, fosmidomycin resistance protein